MSQNESSKSKSHTGAVTVSILAVVLIYFAFPGIVYVPLLTWYHDREIPSGALRWNYVLYRPAEKIGDYSKWYAGTLRGEWRFLLGAFNIEPRRNVKSSARSSGP